MNKHIQVAIGVGALALIVNLGAGFATGMAKPMESDAFYYLDIAKNLAAGKGFVLAEGFWPDQPTMSRSPAWPFVTAIGLRLFPMVSADVVMRFLCILLNAINALLVYALILRILANRWLGFCGAALYLFYPTALYLAVGGASEILFITLALGGALLLIEGCVGNRILQEAREVREGRVSAFSFQLSAFLLFGLAALVRANFVIWIGGFVPMVLVLRITNFLHKATKAQSVRVVLFFLVCCSLFLAPSFLWAMRNYKVSGEFPVLSTLRGQTFYGGNNSEVMAMGKFWGYWIFPDEIPGETSMRELARTMSEVEVDQYYTRKGQEFVKGHIGKMPLLCVGKLVRAYIPVPWKMTPGLLVVNGYRALLYGLIFWGLWRGWRQVDPLYRWLVVSLVVVNVITVIAFWGCARFAFAVEPFLLPLAVAGGWVTSVK